MTKKLKFKKLIINLEDDGSFKDGKILYQQAIDGKIEHWKRFNSLTINNMPFNKGEFAKVLESIRGKTKQTEGVADV